MDLELETWLHPQFGQFFNAVSGEDNGEFTIGVGVGAGKEGNETL